MGSLTDILDTEGALGFLSEAGFTGAERALKELRTLLKTPFSNYLDLIAEKALASPSCEDALGGLTTLAGVIPAETLIKFLSKEANLERLIMLAASSPYLTRFLANKPEWFSWLFFEGGLDGSTLKGSNGGQAALTEELRGWTSAAANFDEYSSIIRSFRNREYLRLGLQDLLHLRTMQEITAGLSDLAGACLEVAHDFCLGELTAKHGEPIYLDKDEKEQTAEFSIIALGKLGGRELNFCSDIDLLYIYTTEKGESRGSRAKNGPP